MNRIGDRIKERREELGLSQEDLAIKLGYKSRSSVNKIELGIYNLKQSKIKAIADALQTTPQFIMGWEEKPSHDDIQILISQLDDTDLNILRSFIENTLLTQEKYTKKDTQFQAM